MRLKRTTQMSLYEPAPVDHPLGEELESISGWLDCLTRWLPTSARSRSGAVSD